MRKITLRLYFWIVAAGLLYALCVTAGLQFPCFYLQTTGLQCPGCGITRMFFSMLRLDFTAAFRYNPVMFVLFFVWNAVGLFCICTDNKIIKSPKPIYILFWTSFAVMLLFWPLRNL